MATIDIFFSFGWDTVCIWWRANSLCYKCASQLFSWHHWLTALHLLYYSNGFFKVLVPNHVLFLSQTSTVEYSESDLGEWCQEPANMLGGVPRHPCGIYTPSVHSEQLFGVLVHCPTMITQLGIYLKKTHESRVFGTLKKHCYVPNRGDIIKKGEFLIGIPLIPACYHGYRLNPPPIA